MFINTSVDAGREFLYLDMLSAPFSTSLQFSTMADPSTGCMIVKAICASLRLASNSPELLTLSQLYAMKGVLYETLSVIEGRIRTAESGKRVC